MANTNKNGALEAVAEREMIFADCSQSRAYANLECGAGFRQRAASINAAEKTDFKLWPARRASETYPTGTVWVKPPNPKKHLEPFLAPRITSRRGQPHKRGEHNGRRASKRAQSRFIPDDGERSISLTRRMGEQAVFLTDWTTTVPGDWMIASVAVVHGCASPRGNPRPRMSFAAFEAIALREGLVERHVRFLMPLAFVAPQVIEAIADGAAAKVSSLWSEWLGREDSNLRMAESKSAALPLGDAPTRSGP
jgi:hypothetical protein